MVDDFHKSSEPIDQEFHSINPATEKILGSYKPSSEKKIFSSIRSLKRGYEVISEADINDRSEILLEIADNFTKHRDEMANNCVLEMGKPKSQALAEIDKCILTLRYFAKFGSKYLRDLKPISKIKGASSHVSFEPKGIILAIMPWNFPYWQIVRFFAPALLGGNVALVKHAPNVPKIATTLSKYFRLSSGVKVLDGVLISEDRTLKLISEPDIAAVTLTGSTRAGRIVAAAAGSNLKPCVLELGGKDVFIVSRFANVDLAAKLGVLSRCQNNGQSCIAAKRFIVQESIYDTFKEKYFENLNALNMTNPENVNCDLGPLASAKAVKIYESQLKLALSERALFMESSHSIPQTGYYVKPGILEGLKPNSKLSNEEIFAPVAEFYRFKSFEDAINIANCTRYGLGATIMTTNGSEKESAKKYIKTGQIFINGMVASYPNIPFGGFKDSGYGKELGEFGLRSFEDIKSVVEFDIK